MTESRRRATPTVRETAGEETGEPEIVVLDSYSSESEVARLRLRGRWELASVLNFLNVFEPVIGRDSRVSAEEIETALIKPNNYLTQLHTTLLKGIPPVSKTLNGSEAWVTVLCKKLAMWWPWVAEGEIPLAVANGEEIARYKELDPTIRLLILKALCEIRAEQDDTVSYINDALKHGTELSYFRKDKIGGDGNGTAYWYDGNTTIGYRLYREVKKFESKAKVKGKGPSTFPTINFQWETLATNLMEFRKVADEFSSSKVIVEVAVGKTIETDVIPVLEKLQKKKERALKRQQRQEMLPKGFQTLYGDGITRSRRNCKAVSYTFDEYDRAIDEAIQLTKRRKTVEEQRHEGKHSEHGNRNDLASNGDSDTETDSRDSSVKNPDPKESVTDNEKLQRGGNVDEDTDDDDDYDGKKDDDNDDGSDSSKSDKENDNLDNRNHAMLQPQKQTGSFALKPVGSRWSKRLAGDAVHPVVETRHLGTKNRLRQRPTRNTALESIVVPDSDDGKLSESMSSGISGRENQSPDADSEDDSDN